MSYRYIGLALAFPYFSPIFAILRYLSIINP